MEGTPTYTAEVALAYAGSLGLLAALLALTWVQSRRSRRRLAETEGRRTVA